MNCTYEKETQKIVFPTHSGDIALSEVEILTLLSEIRKFKLETLGEVTPVTDSLMTIEEAARYLRVSIPTIYNWIRSNKAPVKKIGGSYRFRKADLDRCMEAK